MAGRTRAEGTASSPSASVFACFMAEDAGTCVTIDINADLHTPPSQHGVNERIGVLRPSILSPSG